MFNFNRITAHLKADIRGAKRFFTRKEKTKPFEPKEEHVRLDAPRPKPKKQTNNTVSLARVGFGTFSRVKRCGQFQTDHSSSATTHRLRVAGKEKTRHELRAA